jgi:putative ABC transport system ATP-binding protein
MTVQEGQHGILKLAAVVMSFHGPDGTVRALDGVSLAVSPGELVVVEGPSGCGKTTLLLAAGGLLRPARGTVTLDGEDLYDIDPEERCAVRADKVGFVFQQFHLIPYLSVRNNVLSPTIARRKLGASKRAGELIRHFNMEHRQNHLPAQLSTGERQRTALARALMNDPQLILADEPTGNLDQSNADAVFGYFAEFVAQGGSALVVTHDPRASQRATRVLSMRDGTIS